MFAFLQVHCYHSLQAVNEVSSNLLPLLHLNDYLRFNSLMTILADLSPEGVISFNTGVLSGQVCG